MTNDLVVEVHARTPKRSTTCPDCGNTSHHVHSYYFRQPTDVPIGGRLARLRLRVKRFLCANVDCPRLTFAEPLPGFLARYSRCSLRLAETLEAVAFALGGQPGGTAIEDAL